MKIENVDDEVKVTKKSSNNKEDVDSLKFEYIEDLPSKYKLYPIGTKIFGRALKLGELKKISTMTEHNSDNVIYDILKNCIKGINVEEIISADKLYLIFWLRANTYRESGYTVDFYCQNCEKESSYEFNLNNLKVKYIDDNFTLDNLSFSLTNGDKISFHIPKIFDEKKLTKFKITYASILKDINNDFFDISTIIDSINGEEMDVMDKYEYVTKLEPKYYSQLKSKIKKWEFGIKTELDVVCKKCGGNCPVGITFREEFFIPDYNDE